MMRDLPGVHALTPKVLCVDVHQDNSNVLSCHLMTKSTFLFHKGFKLYLKIVVAMFAYSKATKMINLSCCCACYSFSHFFLILKI